MVPIFLKIGSNCGKWANGYKQLQLPPFSMTHLSCRNAYPTGIMLCHSRGSEEENGVCHSCRILPVLFDSYVGSFPQKQLKQQ
jgi:hypothetical protein